MILLGLFLLFVKIGLFQFGAKLYGIFYYSTWLLSADCPLYSVYSFLITEMALQHLLTLHNLRYHWLALSLVAGHLCMVLQNLTLLTISPVLSLTLEWILKDSSPYTQNCLFLCTLLWKFLEFQYLSPQLNETIVLLGFTFLNCNRIPLGRKPGQLWSNSWT